ncbi:hypothetical protein FM020_05400 [Acinetobacter tandoii]|nr:hypothetical protein FM020_05400 [Acinetobacter tandoii]
MIIETTYFGLTNTDLAFWSMIGTWLASIGTISAVITSLYLARKNDKVNLIITSNLIFLVGYLREFTGDDHYVCIEVTNNGNKPVTIQNIAWKMSKNKSFIVPMNPNPITDTLPKIINYGDTARWAIEVNAIKTLWIPDFIKDGIKRKHVKKWKIAVSLSTGELITVKPNVRIIELIQSCLPE